MNHPMTTDRYTGHPLTDEILEVDFDYIPWFGGLQFAKGDMCDAYDLGYQAGYEKGTEDEAWAQVEREAGESL